MNRQEELLILDAFTSLVRTDYISLDDFTKLNALYNYYVDYYHKVPLILQEQDNIIIGRRGTGKTTLLYRSYVECLNTWEENYLQSKDNSINANRVLPIYVDLNKCITLSSDNLLENEVHNVFLQELVRNLGEQIERFWPKPNNALFLLESIFGDKKQSLIHKEIENLAKLLVEGRPFIARKKQNMEIQSRNLSKNLLEGQSNGTNSSIKAAKENELENFEKATFETINAISIGDFLNSLKKLKLQANISSIVIFIDEFSSLNRSTQRKLSSLLKHLLGNKSGIYFKLSVITDNFDIGDILIPRDLTPISLDLDDIFEGVNNISDGIDSLYEMTKMILETRLQSFLGDTIDIKDIFQEPEKSLRDLAIAGMGVPRTIGYALQRSWNNSLSKRKHSMSKSEVLSGIKSVSLVYLNTFLGAIKSGTLPIYQGEIWHRLINRAQVEKIKSVDRTASHFHVLPKREPHLSKLSEYLIIHLFKKARTTKKDTTKRHLYCFDFGVCHEYDLGFSIDKDTIRQQRFVYDEEIQYFDKEFDINFETTYLCKRCQMSYTKDQLYLEKLDYYIDRCPKCNQPLIEKTPIVNVNEYTEEESKIIGSIYADTELAGKLAWDIAEETGSSTQKVSTFAKKLEKKGLIYREFDTSEQRYRYRPVKREIA